MTEDDVQIKRNKMFLEKLRKEDEIVAGAGFSNGHAESSNSINRQNEGTTIVSDKRVTGRESTPGEANDATQGLRERIRPVDGPNVDSTQSISANDRRPKIDFHLRNPFNWKDVVGDKKPIKLFSKIEANAELERMTDIYYRGSGLIDDLLEIVVKDHEPVEIWQLDEEEANMLATLHLQRAQHDEGSARSARQLLALYDRIYFWVLVGPRAKQTYTHIREHNGLSFK